MMTDDEIIAVVQAHKEGKPIEIKSSLSDNWFHSADPDWNFRSNDYRVAPEPRWIDGYCFPKDIHEKPTIGMIKVNQVKLSSGENPIQPRKPREFIVNIYSDGSISSTFERREDWIEQILVREV